MVDLLVEVRFSWAIDGERRFFVRSSDLFLSIYKFHAGSGQVGLDLGCKYYIVAFQNSPRLICKRC